MFKKKTKEKTLHSMPSNIFFFVKMIFSVSPLYMYIGEPLDDGLIFPDPSDLEIFMDNASTIFHSVINWVALTAETIVSNPLILIFSIVPYIGLGVSIYARIKRSKK